MDISSSEEKSVGGTRNSDKKFSGLPPLLLLDKYLVVD